MAEKSDITRRDFLEQTTRTAASLSLPIPVETIPAASAMTATVTAASYLETKIIAYTSPIARRLFELTNGVCIDVALEKGNLSGILNDMVRDEIDEDLLYDSLKQLPEKDPVREAYRLAIASRSLEENEREMLIQEILTQRGQTKENLEEICEDRKKLYIEEEHGLEDIGYSNAYEIIHRSGISLSDLFEKWCKKSRKKPPENFTAEFSANLKWRYSLSSESDLSQTLIDDVGGSEVEALQCAIDDEVLEEIHQFWPTFNDNHYGACVFGNATEEQIIQCANLLRNPASALFRKFSKEMFVVFQDECAYYLENLEATASEEKPEESPRNTPEKHNHNLQEIITALRSPAERIAAQIQTIILTKSNS